MNEDDLDRPPRVLSYATPTPRRTNRLGGLISLFLVVLSGFGAVGSVLLTIQNLRFALAIGGSADFSESAIAVLTPAMVTAICVFWARHWLIASNRMLKGDSSDDEFEN